MSGRELLQGHRELAYLEFGPMAFEVFRHWGVRSSEDVGRIVFDLVENGFLGKTDEDSLEDFIGGSFLVVTRWAANKTTFSPPRRLCACRENLKGKWRICLEKIAQSSSPSSS